MPPLTHEQNMEAGLRVASDLTTVTPSSRALEAGSGLTGTTSHEPHPTRDSGTAYRLESSTSQAHISGPQGYQRLAHLMGAYPDHAIFRRFGWLSSLNLMRLQAELAALELDLKECQQQNEEDEQLRNLQKGATYSTSFATMARETHCVQLELMKKSTVKLQEYNALLLQTAQVTALGRPEKLQENYLSKWLHHSEGGNNFQYGAELVDTWDERNHSDFIGISRGSASDGDLAKVLRPGVIAAYDWFVTEALVKVLPRAWASRLSKNRERKLLAFDEETKTGLGGAVYDYTDSKAIVWSRWIATTLVTVAISLLPALMILWLNSRRDTQSRIYITIGATGALGLAMKSLTNANMKEILAVTIAFAAVEVVFIGSVAGSGGGSPL